MKKFSFMLLALVACMSTYASPVDPNTAKTVGYNFLLSKFETGKLGNADNLKLAYKSVSNDGNTCFYVFNLANTKGFVIVSADDAVKPILAYSTDNSYLVATPKKKVPAHVASWMDKYTKQINSVIKQKITASATVQNTWDGLKNAPIASTSKYQLFGTAVVNNLLKTTWDQSSELPGPPYTYNAFCPFDTSVGDRGVTGCVATAISQIMKYWNYPTKGIGKHTYTPPSSCRYLGKQTFDFGNTTFQWNLMPNSIDTTSSQAAINAVATLIYACGVSVDMDYSTDLMEGSGSYVTYVGGGYVPNAQEALVTNFGYDNSLRGVFKTNYTDTVWVGILKNEFNNKRPVVYQGQGSEGGHCWLATGYDNQDNIYFNWGWSGYDNGFYSIENLAPPNMNITFTSDEAAIIGIQPKISYKAAQADSLALVALYDSASGSSWTNNSGWLNGPVSNWYGVALNQNGTVASINLAGNNLSGSIPYSLQNLKQLTTLDLSNNNFTGTIPSSIFNLDSLLLLDLSYNQFSGTIPAFPQGGLPQLNTLKIAGNQLSGTIPNSISNLSSLSSLDLSGNQLASLPTNFPTGLGILDLSNNSLAGTITASTFRSLTSLQTLVLSNNKFTGTIPKLTTLQYMYLDHNQFTGSLPTLSPSISVMDVSFNNLSGALSKTLFTAYGWQGVHLSNNQFTGALPSFSSTNLSGMYILAANNNKFTGTIPAVTDLTALVSLDLSNNAFTGAIPSAISTMQYSLSNLSLEHNQLSGPIQNLFDSLLFLYKVDVSSNKFNFSGMSYVANLSRKITTDIYAPQAEVKLTDKGGKLSVTVGDVEKNNTYNWYDGNGLVQTITGDSTFTPPGLGNYYMAATNPNSPALTLYSDTINFVPLPITLLDFRAIPTGKEVLVTWQTATELNTNRFNIQHSTNGASFTNLGSIKAVGSGANSYQFADLSPVKGTDYYRLQSVDNDGALSYSKVVSINFAANGSPFTLFPNPVKDITTIQGTHIASVQVIDNLGRVINSQTLNDTTNPIINLGALQAGVYHLRIQTTDGKASGVNFVKE